MKSLWAKSKRSGAFLPHHHPLFWERKRLWEALADLGCGEAAGAAPACGIPAARLSPPSTSVGRGEQDTESPPRQWLAAACPCQELTNFIPVTAERGERHLHCKGKAVP